MIAVLIGLTVTADASAGLLQHSDGAYSVMAATLTGSSRGVTAARSATAGDTVIADVTAVGVGTTATAATEAAQAPAASRDRIDATG